MWKSYSFRLEKNSSKMYDNYSPEASSDTHQQTIRLSREGKVLSSDDQLFPITERHEQDLLNLFPLLESIFPILTDPANTQNEWSFRAVETVRKELPGIYDYYFKKEETDGQITLLWIIFDRTDFYTYARQKQQKRNEEDLNG
jgi:hypothetical protein